jgi:uncharacterized protein (TIGR03083 family)
MTREAVIALGLERREVIRLCRSLSDEEWNLPSDCAGWTVQDVIAHMASTLHPSLSLIKAFLGPDVEDANEVLVAERRGLSPSEQLAEYETWSGRTLRLLGVVQRQPLASMPAPLGDLGTHPAHWLADAGVFDHYTHLRVDLLQPTGPLDRPVPPSDPMRLRPTITWMLELLPHLSRSSLAWLDDPVDLRLVGPGGGTWGITRRSDRIELVPGGAGGRAAASIVSTTPEFVVWATKRRDWRERDVDIEGDDTLAARVLDSIQLF